MFSLCALLVLWPFCLLLAAVIVIDSPGPAFYRHKRIGFRGREIYIYKFRSMIAGAESAIDQFSPEQRSEWEANFKLDSDPRVTEIGDFLRRTSLDELPQLLNILGGSLSVVGPRPVVCEELEKYGADRDRFLSVKPGLTGYWQAYARSDCSYEQRMDMELAYVEGANIWWDIKIIFATVGAVLRRKGAK